MTAILGGFLHGFSVPLRGLQLIAHRSRVRKLALIPIALTIVVFVAGFILAVPMLFPLVENIVGSGVSRLGFYSPSVAFYIAHAVLDLLAWPTVLFFLLFLFLLLSRVVALPFYAMLAERALIDTGIKADRGFRFADWLKSSSRLVLIALCKLLVFAILGAALLLLSFVPGLGVVSAAGFLLLAAFDIVDISFDALDYGLKKRFSFFLVEFPAFAGLATCLGLVFLLPGLNFLLFPAAVAGTHVVIRRHMGSVSGVTSSTI